MIDLNTRLMSHLENIFCLTIREMGSASFERHLQIYIDNPRDVDPKSESLAEDFMSYLLRSDAARKVIPVARFELAKWLGARVGPRPLCAADLQNTPIERLLGMQVRRHPTAEAIEFDGERPATLVALYPTLGGADGVLLSALRRGMLVLPLTRDELGMLLELAEPRSLFSMLVGAKATAGSPSIFHRLLTLGVVVSA